MSIKEILQAMQPEAVSTENVGDKVYTQAIASSQSAVVSIFGVSIPTPTYGTFQFQAVLAHQAELFAQSTASNRLLTMPMARMEGVIKDVIEHTLNLVHHDNSDSLYEIPSDLSVPDVIDELKEELFDSIENSAITGACVVRQQGLNLLDDCKSASASCQNATRIKLASAVATRLTNAPPIEASESDINEAFIIQPTSQEDQDEHPDEAVYETFKAEL